MLLAINPTKNQAKWKPMCRDVHGKFLKLLPGPPIAGSTPCRAKVTHVTIPAGEPGPGLHDCVVGRHVQHGHIASLPWLPVTGSDYAHALLLSGPALKLKYIRHCFNALLL
jgi:hypothetical protein